jgi:hypothetical protein
MGERAESLHELAEEVEDVEDKESEIEVLSDSMGKWINNVPIRSHDDIVSLYANEYDMNLTQARKQLSDYPLKYEIQGNNIPDIIKEMRYYRRTLKGETKIKFTKGIDNLIDGYSDYLDKCIDSVYWVRKYKIPLRKMNYNEYDLNKLNEMKSESNRRNIIDCLCKYWEADLDRKDIGYNSDYSRLTKEMNGLKKQFKQLLKQSLISTSPKDDIKKAILNSVCNNPGISSRQIHDLLPKKLQDRSSPQIIAKMASDENITNVDGSFYKLNDDIKKDIYAYTAAFIDSDGYITMDKNYNPRVGMVATGERGKAFMLEMHKSLGIGRLHLDQKSPQDTRPVNRLNFYSAADVGQLLGKCEPHFRMKGPNAKLLQELIKIKKHDKKKSWYKDRCAELFKLMKYYNHRDNTRFDWKEWDIDIDNIHKLENNSKMEV